MNIPACCRNLKVVALILLLCITVPALSQRSFKLSGTVKHTTALENISVMLLPVEEQRITDKNGAFSFNDLPPGNYELRFSAVGFATETRTVSLHSDTSLIVELVERIVGLKEVKVTAASKKIGSSSVIDKSAIIHTQPVSLADVLQLVPGQLAVNPALGVAQQVNLRQIPSTTDASRANALGTQIIMDGVPMSNNANLQTDVNILNAAPSALPPFSTVSGRGNDLRQIPADNIENIEVVRGIPSARFGDLTSGLIIVNSRFGAFKPEVRVRLNPNVIQGAVLAGFNGKNNRNVYNINADVLNARDDVRDPFNRYTRVQAQFGWQRAWDEKKKFTTTTIASGYKTLDNLKQNPDDQRYQSRYYSDDYNLKLSTEGRWKADKQWLTSISYTAALTYGQQKSFYQTLITRDLYPLSTAMHDTTMPGVYGKSEYLNQTTVDGKPLNGYARVEATLLKTILSTRHRFIMGSEWRMDVNNGQGRLFDPINPPRQNYSMGDRPRRYDEIPALHQLAYYLEDRLSGNIANHNVVLQAGVRMDNLAPTGLFSSKYKTILSPRINLATEISKGWWIKGGYGIAAKMPTLNYLYPGTRYFDLVNFNYFANNPAERLVIITTRTINLDDQRLLPYQSRKWEAGFDIDKKEFAANVSFFQETTTGAIGMNREVKPFTYAKLRAQSTPAGQPPLLDPVPVSIDTFFAAYDIPVNNRHIMNKGVEYSIDLPEIKSLRTSFNITGAYIQTTSYDDGLHMDAATAYQSNNTPQRIAIYQSASKVTASRLNTSIRFIHRIPALNMVFSALWQTVWISENRPGQLNPYPVAYMNRKGEIIALNEQDAKAPAYEDLVRPVGTLLTTRYPPLHLFNIRCTKEWKKGFGLSFYANNFLNYRPLHADNNTGGLVRRNEALFFGAEFNISIQ
jgi:outer membrane receptor for ferrienterochelin and colicin